MYKTSVILPLYNEAETINKTLAEVNKYAHLHPDIYFLFVNDGSTDNTAEILKKSIPLSSNVSIFNLEKNVGKAGALKQAINRLDSEYIIFTDGDMAYSMDHIDVVLKSLEKNDIAIGNRKLGENQSRKMQRFIAGEAFNRLARIMLNLNITDTQAGIKGFKGNIAKELFRLSRIKDFAFDAELLYIAKQKGYKIEQVPAKVNKSHEYNPSTIKVLRDSPGMFFSLFKMIGFRIRGKYNG